MTKKSVEEIYKGFLDKVYKGNSKKMLAHLDKKDVIEQHGKEFCERVKELIKPETKVAPNRGKSNIQIFDEPSDTNEEQWEYGIEHDKEDDNDKEQ